MAGTRVCRCSARCHPPSKPGAGAQRPGRDAVAGGPFQACPGLCSAAVPGTSYLGNVRNAPRWGFFLRGEPSVPGAETPHPACPASRRQRCPLAPGCLPACAGLEHPRGSWGMGPAEPWHGVPHPRRGFGVLAKELGCRVAGLVTQGATADRLALAGPGSARGQALGWLAAAPSLLVRSVPTPPAIWSRGAVHRRGRLGESQVPGLERRDVVMPAATTHGTAPCASAGASGASGHDPGGAGGWRRL